MSYAVVAGAAVVVAIGTSALLTVEHLRRRRAVAELGHRRATVDKLTEDVGALRRVLQDYIQQREGAEEVLRRGEERYRALVDNLTTIVFQVDRELRWTFLNSAWYTVTARSPAECIGRPASEELVADDVAGWECLLRSLLGKERTLGEQLLRVRCARGGVHWLEARAIPMLDRNGSANGVSGTLTDVTSRVAAEGELRRQQTLYRLIAENSSDVIVLIAVHGGRFTYVSPSARHVLGYAPEELVGVEWWTLLDPADSDRMARQVQALRERRPVTEAGRVRRKDGTWIWLEARADAVLDDGGEVIGYRIAARDVTERRAAELALMESEAKYRLLAESIDDIVCLQDLDGTALYYSASTEKALGFTPGELVGKDVFALTHPDDLTMLAGEAYLAVLRGETPLVEWRCLRKDGSYIWVETHTTLLRTQSGVPDRLLSVTRDIEARKRAEQALRLSEERMRALVSRAAYGIFRSTRGGRFLDANPALVAMLGYESEEELLAIDIPAEVYVDAEERERWMAAIDLGQHVEWVDVTWRKRDGAVISVRLSMRAARDPHGEILWYEGIAENVTERLRREAVVRRAERMASLGHTLAGVAHELNNPLAAISGFAQILLKTSLPKDDRTAIETIHREARRAAKIVKDLLTFSRRQESAERQRVDLNGIVRYIADTQRYAMETRGMLCELALSDEPALVAADPAQLEQVMLNLLVNARQALEAVPAEAPAGRMAIARHTPMIVIRTAVRDGAVSLEISDNGPGIGQADLSRIWDPFWTTKDEGEGTGLGLSVVHGIIIGHGGSIDVESSVGSGTTFTITLPRFGRDVADGRPAEVAPAAPATPQAARPLDILVVDDEEVIVGLLVRYFSSRGHAVVPAHEGRQALRVAEQGTASFDVVICDLRMPGMDGSDVIKRLKELPSCRSARFILSTGDTATPAVRQRIEGLSLSAIVDKPYEVEALRRIVEEG